MYLKQFDRVCIQCADEIPLDDIPHHSNTKALKRLGWPGFPVHLAAHRVEISTETRAPYVDEHHHEFPELNILVADEDSVLTYEMSFDGRTMEVESPSAIWIPPAVRHSARALSGRGLFVCIILSPTEEAFGAENT